MRMRIQTVASRQFRGSTAYLRYVLRARGVPAVQFNIAASSLNAFERLPARLLAVRDINILVKHSVTRSFACVVCEVVL